MEVNESFLPFFFPPWMRREDREAPEPIKDDPPLRVQVAIAFLDKLTNKTATKGISSPVGQTEIPGQELLPIEHHAQAEALKLLIAYFNGSYKLTRQEREADRQLTEFNKARLGTCPKCEGSGYMGHRSNGMACDACNGKGKLLMIHGKGQP